jgi:uncharacterized protein YktA (UPF0223 family)
LNKPTKKNTLSTFKDKRVDIDMTRDEMISVLEMITRYSYAYLKSLSDEKLKKLYEERA